MVKREFYQKAYDILGKRTPLLSDCGNLCNQACCDSEDEEAGMYLFPGEELMYQEKPDWLRIEESDFTYGNEKPVLIAICKERCDRELRPLACRIFPLTPYIGYDGILKIKKDPRAVPMCPLAKPNGAEIDRFFFLGVTEVFRILKEDADIYSFVFELSRLLDEQSYC